MLNRPLQRIDTRHISSRKRLNIPSMPADRLTSERPALIFGQRFAPRFPLQMQQQQLQEEKVLRSYGKRAICYPTVI